MDKLDGMDKLKGIDILKFKSYLESTGFVDIGGAIWGVLNMLFVNLPFMILNVIVLVYSSILKALEKFSLYDLYKVTVYDISKNIWNKFISDGTGGLTSTSILFVLLSVSVVYLFVQWALSRGNFSQKVLHFLMVIILSFGYFGTINGTKGGIFILDGIHDLSKEMIKTVNSVSISISEDKTVDSNKDFSDSYIGETSYQAYLYVNTGRTDEKFFNNQTEKEEEFPTDKILGSVDENGEFKAVLEKDSSETVTNLGKDSGSNNEKNRWLSAVPDFLFIKMLYVLSSIFKAVVLPLPYLVIYILRIGAELLVLSLMFLFPIAIILSFIPKFQDLLFGFFKLILISATVPSFGSVMLLVVAMVNLLISTGLANVLSSDGKQTATSLLLENIASSFVSMLIYIGFWKNKGFIFNMLAGSMGSNISKGIDDGVKFAGSGFSNMDDYMKHLKNQYKDTEITPDQENRDSTNVKDVTSEPEKVHVEPEQEEVHVKPEQEEIRVEPEQEEIRVEPEQEEIRVEPEQEEVHVKPEQDEVHVEPEQEEVHIEPEPEKVHIESEQDEVHIESEPEKVHIESEQDEVHIESEQDEVHVEPEQDEVHVEPEPEKVHIESEQDEVHIEPEPEEVIFEQEELLNESSLQQSETGMQFDDFSSDERLDSSIFEEQNDLEGGSLIEEVD